MKRKEEVSESAKRRTVRERQGCFGCVGTHVSGRRMISGLGEVRLESDMRWISGDGRTDVDVGRWPSRARGSEESEGARVKRLE
jgi:hypothetical protein